MEEKCDFALLRSKSLQKQALEQRAVAIASETPQPKRLMYSTHWQSHCWFLTANECQEGELLIPSLGISRDYSAWARNTYDYFLATYPGDSGSGIVNEEGQLIGIVTGTFNDKVKDPISTFACGPRSMRTYLEGIWGKVKP